MKDVRYVDTILRFKILRNSNGLIHSKSCYVNKVLKNSIKMIFDWLEHSYI